MSKSSPPPADNPSDDDRELFERLRERYEGEDDEVVRICDLVVQSDSDSEVAN